MKKIISYSLMVFTVFGLILGVSVFAYKGDLNQVGPNYDVDRHEAMQIAFENKDYNAWRELMSQNSMQPKVLDKVNEENFEKFVMLREARLSGDVDKVNELKSELGFENYGQGKGKMKNNQRGLNQKNCPYMN